MIRRRCHVAYQITFSFNSGIHFCCIRFLIVCYIIMPYLLLEWVSSRRMPYYLSPTFHLITSSLILHIRAVTTSTLRMAMSLPTMNWKKHGKRRVSPTGFRFCIASCFKGRLYQTFYSPVDILDCSQDGLPCTFQPK